MAVPPAPPKGRPGSLLLTERLVQLNYKYELLIGHYVLDSWEKMIVNAIILTCVAFTVHMLVTSIPLDAVMAAATNAMHAAF
ncbi:hypothetical protein LPJ61_000906 [Coemansia biformis]|uniref:Uncharacterized protein n=1 Tax=Coemansia biformis TaxID=1286918 RepID=A0A9W7YHF9_9FUNG|nr:hypothetical protein LPJ61_000906 [Coemansia biformis]